MDERERMMKQKVN